MRGLGERWRRLAVFPKVDAASPRGLMAPPGLRPWAPRVLSGIGSAFRTGSPGSALGSYVVSLCAYPAWDTQVSRSWPLACPIRGLPFSRLTDWGGTVPSAPFCMPPVGGGPLLWLTPPPSPQLRWWDYGYSALCHMTLQGSGELTFPSGGGAVGRRGAFPRAKPGLLVFPSRQRRGCLV